MALVPVQVIVPGLEDCCHNRPTSFEQQHAVPIVFVFRCRYIPVGLLEHLPQKINERPPYYIGRDYLETLMASQNVDDWIKIR